MLFLISTSIFLSCSTTQHHKYLMPYLDSKLESKHFVDSLILSGKDTIMVYYIGQSVYEYYIFWFDKSELQIRKVEAYGIFEIADWTFGGLYRDRRIFKFFTANKAKIYTDTIDKSDLFQYHYVNIELIFDTTYQIFHLPHGVHSKYDNTIYHFARLIESTIFNIEHSSGWKQAEKKVKYFPRNYDPNKKKWQKWREEKTKEGKVYDH